jgi:hypothetical protein
MTTKTIYTEVEVDVDLSDFDTADLVEELNDRGSHGLSFDDTETLTKAWQHDREGRRDEAYTILREYMLNKLGRVI